jgi:hypothetical protein
MGRTAISSGIGRTASRTRLAERLVRAAAAGDDSRPGPFTDRGRPPATSLTIPRRPATSTVIYRMYPHDSSLVFLLFRADRFSRRRARKARKARWARWAGGRARDPGTVRDRGRGLATGPETATGRGLERGLERGLGRGPGTATVGVRGSQSAPGRARARDPATGMGPATVSDLDRSQGRDRALGPGRSRDPYRFR